MMCFNAVNGVKWEIYYLFYPRPEGRGYHYQFSDKLPRCPVVHGWDTDQTSRNLDGVHAISQKSPEGRGYRHQFFDKTQKSPAIHGWDNRLKNSIIGMAFTPLRVGG